MTSYEFNVLPEEYQLAAVAKTGSLLWMGWDRELAVSLYQLPGRLLIELVYDTHTYRIRRFQSLTNARQLADYVSFRSLPEGLSDATAG